jgi:type I restriction enzyme S subunit
MPFVGMDNVEAHTMRLLGTVPAGTMRSNATHFIPKDILYGRLRPYLNKVLAPTFEGLASAEFIPLTPEPGIDRDFVRYRVNAADFVSFTSHLDEGDRPRVDWNGIRQFDVSLPPSGEQRRIVEAIDSYLTRLDDAVASLERVQAKLKAYRASVLKAAVEGRLVPTEAALARAEKRGYEPAEVLLNRILKERRRRWEEAEVGKLKAAAKAPKNDKWKASYRAPVAPATNTLPRLPEGWCWASVEQLASDEARSIQSGPFGSNLLHSEFQDAGNLVVGIDNVQDGYFSMGAEHRISEEKFQELEHYRARGGDVLVTVMATVGRVCVIPDDLEPAIITKHVYRITPNRCIVEPSYLHLALWGGPAVRKQMFGQVIGQTRPGLNGGIIRKLAVPLPPIKEQVRVVESADRLLSSRDKVLAQLPTSIKRVQRLRQAVLKWAFEGKLVDQDPTDEPAEKLLARIRAQRVAVDSAKRTLDRRARGVA